LNCGYAGKDAVKALGALFDGDQNRWYVPGDTDLRPFARWLQL